MKRVTAALAIAALIVLAPLPAGGHTDKQLKQWKKDWKARYALVNVEAVIALDGELLSMLQHLDAEKADMESRHKCQLLGKCPKPKPVARRYGKGVEQWRPLVEKHFSSGQVATAMRVMRCESGGNPNAYNSRSGASGLFQHLKKYWPSRARSAGWGGASVFDPEANIAVAAWLQRTDGWHHWTCA